jgi:glutathione S-transferase
MGNACCQSDDPGTDEKVVGAQAGALRPKALNSAMPSYKLTYWGITGLAESIRQTFALAGIPFEDERVTGDVWKARKEDPNNKGKLLGLPMLEITNDDGSVVSITQSLAILRYVGSIGKFNGKALYPEDPLTRAYCDEVIGIMEDIRPHMVPTFAIADQAEKEKARADLVTAPDGKMIPGLTKLNDTLGRFAFAAGDAPSVADCYIATVCYLFQAPSFLDGFPEGSLAEFKNITGLKDKLCSLPPLQEYYKDAETYRTPFKVA